MELKQKDGCDDGVMVTVWICWDWGAVTLNARAGVGMNCGAGGRRGFLAGIEIGTNKYVGMMV
jgi:hypothetical protein